ncbi:ASCH domain-containing protein [Paracoccus zhejiangensis]|uniref:ASCH domain-containing protein n=1 Tax=Paracoccus zhejiangensis TaxID=1077935 RepID=A0A2H5EWN1_9RHOB|nr:ASCH domain-containing protein [Paracoccus zhejiangensis]AUH63697.1 ASCH domain-containing protein [Paracoccus zhejiangensis]
MASGGDILASENPVGFTFGDSRALNERLLGLVRAGTKTATCGALRDFQADGEEMPVVGRQDIALDWEGKPALRIETVEVTIRRFCDVPEAFALAEGEGDFEDWKTGHIAFFTRNGGFDPEMELVCERFRLVEVLA